MLSDKASQVTQSKKSTLIGEDTAELPPLKEPENASEPARKKRSTITKKKKATVQPLSEIEVEENSTTHATEPKAVSKIKEKSGDASPKVVAPTKLVDGRTTLPSLSLPASHAQIRSKGIE